jgi:hypothetical protein
MNWWQLLLYFLGLVIVSALVGLLLGYMVRRIKNKPWPITWPNHRSRIVSSGNQAIVPTTRTLPSPPPRNDSVTNQQDLIEGYIQKVKPVLEVESEDTPVLPKSDLLVEVEDNLAIAKSPLRNKLVLFRTRVFEENLNSGDILPQGLKDELAEAYTDMTLANMLVGLYTDIGSNSQEISGSYSRLCGKIAERLEMAASILSRSDSVPK